jgi:SpoVK/Ycf46/Vps4 family AAA+-type ATPase
VSISTKTIEILRRLILERPTDFDTRLHLAELLMAQTKGDEALGVLNEALALKPEDPRALRMYARLCYDRHSYEEAKSKLQAAARNGPPDAKSDMLLARVYMRLGNRKAAEEAYDRAVHADPSVADTSLLDAIHSSKPSEPPAVRYGASASDAFYEGESSGITFGDVGGMEEVKEHLRMNIILPLRSPELFREYGKRVGGGILMYGPPGCGKTYISRALAGECNATFYAVGIHEILDAFVGSSEKNMHKLFEQARRTAPAVIFLDEIDALGQKRSGGGDAWGRALRGTVNTLLAEMDNLGKPDKPVLVIGATNTPWSVDPALKRSGRFDRVVFVPPPDRKAREEILRLHLRGKPTEEDVDVEKISLKLEKYSGADIRTLVDRAVEEAIKRAMKSGKTERITTANLLDAAKGMRPTTEEWLATAHDYARYSNEGGAYDQVKAYLDKNP